MDIPELIRKKRKGLVLSRAEIVEFVERYTRDVTVSTPRSTPAVGLVFEKKTGGPVHAGERVCVLYSNARSHVPWELDMIRGAISYSSEAEWIVELSRRAA